MRALMIIIVIIIIPAVTINSLVASCEIMRLPVIFEQIHVTPRNSSLKLNWRPLKPLWDHEHVIKRYLNVLVVTGQTICTEVEEQINPQMAPLKCAGFLQPVYPSSSKVKTTTVNTTKWPTTLDQNPKLMKMIPFKNYSILPINYTSLIKTVKMQMIFGITLLHLHLVLPSVSSYD